MNLYRLTFRVNRTASTLETMAQAGSLLEAVLKPHGIARGPAVELIKVELHREDCGPPAETLTLPVNPE